MPPTINDMPVNILEKICSKLSDDYREKYRFILRNVCQSFRRHVDSWTPKIEEISIFSNFGRITVEFASTEYLYDHENLTVDDLISVLKFPNVKFEKLEIGEKSEEFLENFLLKIESLNLKIHVETVELNNSGREIDILKFCENPEILKIDNSKKIPIEEIIKNFSRKIPKITLKYDKLNATEATEIVRNHNLEYCRLSGPFGNETFRRNILKSGAKKTDTDTYWIFHFPIPDSMDFFEIQCEYHITIQKKTIQRFYRFLKTTLSLQFCSLLLLMLLFFAPKLPKFQIFCSFSGLEAQKMFVSSNTVQGTQNTKA
ncbi:hypothetical protein B9Z55_027001 [Caenorhabditis nigoni]|uniref:F-box domain-containing protein n=1 Tax=Caenorhabditis nigoni TaxID=1611254 RepID=A0A2G5SIY5_9PELO|nr:hypothetical protein B9Z55_027001 [Caenorhabditis nigoni]